MSHCNVFSGLNVNGADSKVSSDHSFVRDDIFEGGDSAIIIKEAGFFENKIDWITRTFNPNISSRDILIFA